MRPHVIEYRPPCHLPPLGDIVTDALVKVGDPPSFPPPPLAL